MRKSVDTADTFAGLQFVKNMEKSEPICSTVTSCMTRMQHMTSWCQPCCQPAAGTLLPVRQERKECFLCMLSVRRAPLPESRIMIMSSRLRPTDGMHAQQRLLLEAVA